MPLDLAKSHFMGGVVVGGWGVSEISTSVTKSTTGTLEIGKCATYGGYLLPILIIRD